MPSTAALGFLSLAEELKADQDPRVQCKTCRWLRAQKPEIRAEWIAALVDYSFSAGSIWRALDRRRTGLTRNSIENCRKLNHNGLPVNKPAHIAARTKLRV